MPTSISTFPIQQEYPRNLPAAAFPNGDDVLLLDGATSGTRGLSAGIITQLAAAQLPANMPVYDGTQGRTTATTGLTTTTDPWWKALLVRVPTSTPTTGGILMMSPDGHWFTGSKSSDIELWSDGSLAVLIGDTGGRATGYRQAQIPAWHQTYSGQMVRLLVYWDGAALHIHTNGVDLSFLESSGGTAPSWGNGIALAYVDVGTLGVDGYPAAFPVFLQGVGTGIWSASDISNYFATGALPPWVQTGGLAGTQLITGSDSTGATDTGFWIKANGATIASGFTFPAAGYVARNALLVPGKQYCITVQNTGTGDVYLNVGPSNVIIGTGAGTYKYYCTPTAGTLFVGSNAGTTASLITLVSQGTIAGMDPTHDGRGGYWPDVSGAGYHFVMPSSGWTPLHKSTRGTPVSTLYLAEPSLWAPVSNVVLMDLTLTAGTAYTAGQVIASIPNLRSAQGIFQVRDLGGSRYYTGGSWSTNGGVTAWFASGVITADLNNWGVQIIPGTSACTLQLVAVSAVTVSQTRNVQLILVHGDIDISAIK